MKKERVVVICPGRGTYTKETLGYLCKYKQRLGEFIATLDTERSALGQPTVSQLDDAETFTPVLHTKGEHASVLIYACAYADFMALDRERYEVVAITGNSMGWYIALACAGALDVMAAFQVVNTMGSMMKDSIIGGQVIYPVVDDEWRRRSELVHVVEEAVAGANAAPNGEAHISIYLGGYVVIGGNVAGVQHLLKALPKRQQYPLQLLNHAAFHTPLLAETSRHAFEMLSRELFVKPDVPVVDGRGHVWQDFATDLDDLYRYTFDDQVVSPYDFTRAVTVCLKEFCPDRLVLLGPGNTLGGVVGQIVIENGWHGIRSKSEFAERQNVDPFLISLGRANPRDRPGAQDTPGKGRAWPPATQAD